MTDDEKAQYLIDLLKPCLHRSRDPEWSTMRYRTAWGTKTEQGLRECIKRVLEGKDLPKIE